MARAEGITELSGDVILQCVGGTAGETATLNLELSANTEITSRLIATGQTEALLIIDDLEGPYGTKHLGTRRTANSIRWTGIPLVAPGLGVIRKVRITNIRVNAHAVPVPVLGMRRVLFFLSSDTIPIEYPEQVSTFVAPGVTVSVGNCAGGALGQAAGSGTMQYSIQFSEKYAGVFKPRTAPGQTTGAPGMLFESESGFIGQSVSGEGLADSGTRLIARFTRLPAGARLFVTTQPTFANSATFAATLMPADEHGAVPSSGSTIPVPPTTALFCAEAGGPVPAAEIAVTNGSATAVWEVTDGGTLIDSVRFGLRVEVPGIDSYLPALLAGLAPMYGPEPDPLSETLPIPRFAAPLSDPHIVWTNDSTRQATLWRLRGGRGQIVHDWSWAHSGGAPGWKIVAVGDFNRDGVNDFVWQEDSTRRVTVWYQGGPGGMTNVGWQWIHPDGAPGWSVVAAADFTRDGIPDLVWQNDATRQVTVWHMGGSQGNVNTAWKWLHSTGAPGWKVVAAADLNLDGAPDLIWQRDDTRQVSVWYLGGAQGDEYITWAWIHGSAAPGWRVAAAADIDRDGTPDIIWQDDSTRAATVWYMGGPQGNVNTAWEWIHTPPALGWSITAGR